MKISIQGRVTKSPTHVTCILFHIAATINLLKNYFKCLLWSTIYHVNHLWIL